jgi:spore coat protein JB
MSLEEKRDCSCESDFKNMINENSYDAEETVDCELREEMIGEIRNYEFAINELALYLDTHPEDEKALCLHRKYCKQAKNLKDQYQKIYGPLTINYPCNKWRWLEEPWPWERGNY